MADALRDHLTIVVPTYNRYPFLWRLVPYYCGTVARFPMLILDSSSEPLERHPRLEGLLRQASSLSYVRYPSDTLPTVKLHDGLRRVKTGYVVMWADDDLMVPRALEQAIRFLGDHPEASLAYGAIGLFQVRPDVVGWPKVDVGASSQRSYTAPTGSQRLLQYAAACTSLFHSVHRTANLQHNFAQCLAVGFGSTRPTDEHRVHRSDLWVELLVSCLAVIQGPTHLLPGLYLLRDRHPGVDSWEESGRDCDLFDWVSSHSFADAYAAFASCLSRELVSRDGMTLRDAQEVVKTAFWDYLRRALFNKWHGHVESGSGAARRRWRQAVRSVPGARRVWRALRSRCPGGEMMPETLLRRSSAYHADFLPIYRAIIGEPIEAVGDDGAAEPVLLGSAGG